MPPSMSFRAVVEKLAPTGEGVVRTNEGVGLVDGVLPGEEVEIEIVRRSRKIWRGRPGAVYRASPDRRTGGHADGCPACDWAHFDRAAARSAKRDLFLETMSRIGRVPASAFAGLAVEPSGPGYRLRSRFHAERREGSLRLGGFAPGTHRVEPLDACEALSGSLRDLLPRLGEALAPFPPPLEIATLESLDGGRRLVRAVVPGESGAAAPIARALAPHFDGVSVVDSKGALLRRAGAPRLWISVGERECPASAGAFFQANRFLVEPLARHVEELAAAVPPGRALDLFGGSGLFAGALLGAGHQVTSVEGQGEAARDAKLARDRWRSGDRWRIEQAPVAQFVRVDRGREDLIVVDPPRAGLGLALSRALAHRARRRLIYVSCDPATLARDLAAILPEGWEIVGARLFDLFALTHRVEAVVALERNRAA
ncbi:MAG: class I SAM-dependent RNA methyltransferase [Thermoanaerobaculia bacterium]